MQTAKLVKKGSELDARSPASDKSMRILIADDHSLMREGLKKLLADKFQGITFGEAENGDEALARVMNEDWDAVLLDISMPGRGGLEVLKQMRAARPGLAVLVLSMHSEDQYAVSALKLGAAGYVSKNTASHDVVGAVQKVLAGGKYVSAALAETLVANLNAPAARPAHDTLSQREYQVMRAIASGRLVKEIAFELSLSVKTISTYRTRILKKMNLSTNSEIIRYALLNKLVD